MRICVMYDCLFPWTVGGAERWYRALAERLASEGHEVTYVTLLQWDEGDEPNLPGVEVVALGRKRRPLYDGEGKRKLGPPLFFGWATLWWLLRRGRRFDVVHTASFPFFSMLSLAVAWPVGRYRILCDWHEVWSKDYWREYLGPLGGRIGWSVQWLTAKVPQRSFAFSRLHGDRLRAIVPGREVVHLTGEYAGSLEPPQPTAAPSTPHIVYAGRYIPEKRVPSLVPAIAWARERRPDLRATLLGDGHERQQVIDEVAGAGLQDVVTLPGFVSAEEVDATFAACSVVVQPSAREGYGMVVVESAARGVPVVVAEADDNAAVELVEDGVNGFVAADTSPAVLGQALLDAIDGGDALRASTCDWFARNAERLSLGRSLDILDEVYGREARARHA
ncbi:MAG: glycosyltransferase [Solirubrobacteraceae bacterium]|nr:glycosyltransferase [Solirubrobacteraceae bacterium]